MYYFIVNTSSRSGKGLKIWRTIKAELKVRNVKYKAYETKINHTATQIAREICSKDSGHINIVILGGDGTINEVINGIIDFNRVSIGVIPVGSGNDFARGLGINNSTCCEQLDRILECEEEYVIDVGHVKSKCADRYFVISAGFGLDAYVCKKAIKSKLKKVLNFLHMGSLTYIILTVTSLFSLKKVNAKAVIDGVERDMPKMIFSAIMNMPSEGGGVPMAPRAKDNDGYLSVASACKIAKWRTFFLLPILARGKHEGIKGFSVKNCERITITSEDEMVLHCDGEYIGDVTEAEFMCIPRALRIRK